MAKKLLFSLLTCTIVLGFSFFSPLEGSNIPKSIISNSDFCDAPPPDSFRVTSINSEVVNFAWIPAWTGATHTITLSKINQNGGWNDIAIYNNVAGTSYSISAPSAGSYKATIATNCTTGGTSSRVTWIIFKIIELGTAGRVPVNPSIVNQCDPVNIYEWEWYGFRVKNLITQQSNLFELEDNGVIRRVFNNPIVAANEAGFFPTGPQNVKLDNPVRMREIGLEPIPIGDVKISIGDPLGTSICIDTTYVDWKPEYELTILKSQSVNINFPGGGSGGGQGLTHEPSQKKTQVQSIFSNSLNISFPNFMTETNQHASINIFDTNGMLQFSEKINLSEPEISINTHQLSIGLHFIQIKSDQGFEIFKALKI